MASASAPGGSRGGLWVAFTAALFLLAAGGLGFVLLSPQAPPAGPTATPQVLIAQTFARDIELLLPSASSDRVIDEAFIAAFLELARLECGCAPQIQPGTLVYLGGSGPSRTAITALGTRYRATLQATILVPEP